MALPANTTAITFANINTELGAVGNSTVSAANMTRSLNDAAVRYLTPGTGKTISTTFNSAISMDNLSTARLREFVASIGTTLRVFSTEPNSYGDMYVAFAAPTGSIYVGKYSPQLNYFHWMQTVTFNNARGTSFIGINTSSLQLFVDSNDRLIVKFNFYYTAKFTVIRPHLVCFDTNGNFLWQLGDNAGSVFTAIVGVTGIDSAVYNQTKILHKGNEGTTSSSLNIIESSNGQLISNNSISVTNYANTTVLSCVGTPGQTNGYVVGSTSNVSYFGAVWKINSSGTIDWSRRQGTTANSYFNAGAVDSAGNVWAVGAANAAGPSPTLYHPTITLYKINSSGTFLFSRNIAYAANVGAPKISIDINDNVYIYGLSTGNTTVNTNIVVSSFNSSGTARWHRSIRAAAIIGGVNGLTSLSAAAGPYLSGSRIAIPFVVGNATNSYAGSTIHLNSSTGSTTGTYGITSLVSITPTITSNATGFTTLVSITSSLSSSPTGTTANVSSTTNTTPQAITFNYIT